MSDDNQKKIREEIIRDMAGALDAPPSKPGIELDEASGKYMVEHAQKAVHTFGRLMITMGKALATGDHHPDQVKIGFDYGVSMAYVEVDVAGVAAAARDNLEAQGLAALLDSITFDEGCYVMPAPTDDDDDDDDGPAPRATYEPVPVSTVRLYLHSTGV